MIWIFRSCFLIQNRYILCLTFVDMLMLHRHFLCYWSFMKFTRHLCPYKKGIFMCYSSLFSLVFLRAYFWDSFSSTIPRIMLCSSIISHGKTLCVSVTYLLILFSFILLIHHHSFNVVSCLHHFTTITDNCVSSRNWRPVWRSTMSTQFGMKIWHLQFQILLNLWRLYVSCYHIQSSHCLHFNILLAKSRACIKHTDCISLKILIPS